MTAADTASRLSRQAAATAHAIRLICRDGFELGFTDHDRPLVFGGTTFRPAPGLSLSPITRTSDLAPDHARFSVGMSDEALSEADFLRGRFDDADIEIWRVDTEQPSARVLLAAGTLGEAERQQGLLVAEYRSRSAALSKDVGRVYQKTCDAKLGDRRCGVDLTDGFEAAATLIPQEGSTLRVQGAPPRSAGYWNGGTLRVLSGELAGLHRPIRQAIETPDGQLEIVLWRPLPHSPTSSVPVTISAGCDKSFATCQEKFANGPNFRGFPTIPGLGVLTVASGEGS
ncbi:MAG: DUF2163 domain-containing protein [Parvularcula sp.]|jgi:uncharacterized phage protein (TIGR02218 family)|nr:DUF2163 domain-containing protein [Parvularcula sp.]